MIICHISDTHGKPFDLKGQYDIVVHSGDMLPDNNSRFKNRELTDIQFQSQWLHNKALKIKGTLKGKPFLFINGNHDFLDGDEFEKILRAYDVNAFCLNNKVVEVNGFKFYGFPHIPYINGCWNNECLTDTVLRNKTIEMVNALKNDYVDVLVSHAPPYKILDYIYYENLNVGNAHLVNQFDYTLPIENRPKWILCGHIHCNFGIHSEWICNVSNAATTQNNIVIH